MDTTYSSSAEWTARYRHSSVAMPDGSIVLTGGFDGSLKNDVWRSTDSGATWTQMTASAGWTARDYHSTVAMPDGSIVLTGGGDDGIGDKNDVWRSMDNGATWTQMSANAEWPGRQYHSTVAMPDGSIILTGGAVDGMYVTNDVWRSTDNGATWTEVNPSAPWRARVAHSSVVMPDGSIVLMGGSDGDWMNDVWRSTDNGATWTQMTPSAEWSARNCLRSVAMPDGSIVLIGGQSSGYNRKNDVWRSTDSGATWTEVNASAGWTARDYHSSVAMPDGSIVMIGGSDGSLKNDVWRFIPVGSSAQNPSHTYTAAGTYLGCITGIQ